MFYYNGYDFQPKEVQIGEDQNVFIEDEALNLLFDNKFAVTSYSLEFVLRDKALEYDDVLFGDVQVAEDDMYEYKSADLGQFYKKGKKSKYMKKDMENLSYGFYLQFNIPFEFIR